MADYTPEELDNYHHNLTIINEQINTLIEGYRIISSAAGDITAMMRISHDLQHHLDMSPEQLAQHLAGAVRRLALDDKVVTGL